MKINYTLNENNILTSYTILPFNENLPFLEIDEQQLEYIKCGYTKIIDGEIYINNYLNEIKQLYAELSEIQKWFKDNDWKVNKYLTKEWKKNDKRWKQYLKDRENKRKKQDEINYLLETLNEGRY